MRKLITLIIILSCIIGLSPGANAGVSTSAVLFLRIAAGARAAGMGEAFVAVADDATTTHWNPAGLGTYPLSSKWFEVEIPEKYRPLNRVAIFQNDAAESDYNKYDVWGISERGLVRYSRGKWYQGDVIETRADQSAEGILRDYTGLTLEENDERVAELMDEVGEANNSEPRDLIDSVKARVMEVIPETYDSRDAIENAFIALEQGYNQCLIDWERFKRIENDLRGMLKDSNISESEADRLLFLAEKSKKRFLPEEITIPFGVNFSGTLTDIKSDKTLLWVTSDSGLYRYDRNRRNWRHYSESDNMPTSDISGIKLLKKKAYLRTKYGLVIYDAGLFRYQDDLTGLPTKPISGVAAETDSTAWAVVDGDLYYYDGEYWRNYIEFEDALDQAPESIYDGMKLFDNESEKAEYLKKYEELNRGAGSSQTSSSAEVFEELENAEGETKTIDEVTAEIDSVGIIEALKAEINQTEEAASKTGADVTDSGKSKILDTIKIPFTAGIPFEVTAMEVDNQKNLWIGTEYGLLRFDGRKWKWYGYRDYTAEEDITVTELARKLVSGDESRAKRLADNIRTVNRLDSETIVAGQTIKTYANPAGSRINAIYPQGARTYFATASGTIFLENGWSRFNEEGLGNKEVFDIYEANESMWFTGEDKVLIRAGARSELVMMHVNWLPELADDIYYEFFSFVKSVEGWGTIGTNITFLSYGSITRTDSYGNELGEFSAFDFAMTLSYGTPLSRSLSGGLSAKVIYSHLSELGAGEEKGSGTSTGLALDIGLLYKMTNRASLGVSLTNIGPSIAYIDVAQADPLPRNLAVGLAYKVIQSNYSSLLLTVEANKSMVAIGAFKDELKEVVLNSGMEYWYGSFIALRAGYIYDQEGDIKTPTLGFGLSYSSFEFDFAYIPSSESVPLANTMRLSLAVGL